MSSKKPIQRIPLPSISKPVPRTPILSKIPQQTIQSPPILPISRGPLPTLNPSLKSPPVKIKNSKKSPKNNPLSPVIPPPVPLSSVIPPPVPSSPVAPARVPLSPIIPSPVPSSPVAPARVPLSSVIPPPVPLSSVVMDDSEGKGRMGSPKITVMPKVAGSPLLLPGLKMKGGKKTPKGSPRLKTPVEPRAPVIGSLSSIKISEPNIHVLPPLVKDKSKSEVGGLEFREMGITNGFVSVRSTVLEPTLPNIFDKKITKNHKLAEFSKFNWPTWPTRLDPIVINIIKRPHEFEEDISIQRHQTDNIIRVLMEINPELLQEGRTGKRKDKYNLPELQDFARRLGLRATGGKPELIAKIKEKRIEMGL